ncbi:MAG: GTP 3',8-cyclase MoaA [Lachnospiraceae bacterium]|nr:GTP 3',8-cyclase MoaA [Lachnospiraceae bacterium]
MLDRFGRNIEYLRISVTDKCNLRCRYCMPRDVVSVPMKDILTIEEIVYIAGIMTELGVKKIKITGGEPLVRRGCCELVRMLKEMAGVKQVTLTTNGVLLKGYLKELKDAGLDGVNISIDTLDEELYKMITGADELKAVLSSLNEALSYNIPVKVNTVSVDWEKIGGVSHREGSESLSELMRLVEFARDKEICVRFIEMMPLGYGRDFPSVPHDLLIPYIKEKYKGMELDEGEYGNGPASYYSIPGFKGRIGFISAINNKFCDSCNRVRLTTKGYLKSCLCYDNGVELMELLRSDRKEAEKHDKIKSLIEEVIFKKPKKHSFEDPGRISERNIMSRIGG